MHIVPIVLVMINHTLYAESSTYAVFVAAEYTPSVIIPAHPVGGELVSFATTSLTKELKSYT